LINSNTKKEKGKQKPWTEISLRISSAALINKHKQDAARYPVDANASSHRNYYAIIRDRLGEIEPFGESCNRLRIKFVNRNHYSIDPFD